MNGAVHNMPRKPTKTKLLEIFEHQYNMSRDQAKAHVEKCFAKMLAKDDMKVVHVQGICGGINTLLDCGFSYAFAQALPTTTPEAVELRVMFHVTDRIGDAETLRMTYWSDDMRKKTLDDKNKAVGEMLKAFGY